MGFIYGMSPHSRACKYRLMVQGTVTIFQYGAGPNGVMRTIGKYMLGSGATFGCASRKDISAQQHTNGAICRVFMSVGSVIRTDTSPSYSEAFARAKYPPIILPRRDIYRPNKPDS